MTRSPALLAVLAAAGLSGAALAQPANDSCANAIPVTPSAAGSSISGTTVGATVDGSTNCGASTSPDVWYTFTLPHSTYITADVCGATWDTVVSIHSGCPGTSANTVICNDDSCGLQSRANGTLNPGTYYVRVSGYGSGNSGPFTLTLTTGNAPPGMNPGPDVIVGEVYDVGYFGQVGDILAYAIGTDACNAGDTTVPWTTSSNHHPVIAQNFYRLKAGHFEQIGQSWLKHGFAAGAGSTCFTCQGGGGDGLGPGCSDIYSSGLNGTQGAGPRSQVNATNGVFPYPFSPTPPPADPTIGRRLQVHFADMDPTQNPGATYYAEAQYITPDDAGYSIGGATGNGLNNSSWRGITFANPNSAPTFSTGTHRTQPAIFAWQTADPNVELAAADYMDTGLRARFWIGARVTDNGNGTWNYEYAVYNLNSDRCGGSFSVPLPAGAVVTNVGFHGVFAHSGEPYENTATNPAPWASNVTSTGISWACTPYATNVNANAIRWGTLYNFRFTANIAPRTGGAVTLGLFKPPTAGSTPASVTVGVQTPGLGCASADFNHDGSIGTDADIQAFFACLSGNCCPTCDPRGADFNGDGAVGTDADIEAFFRVLGGGAC
jgi:hypothetical protein